VPPAPRCVIIALTKLSNATNSTDRAMMKVRPVLVSKKSGDVVHATTGFSGTLCGQVEGFDWRIDKMLDAAELDRVECLSCREYIERHTTQGTPGGRRR
jgi:hypothetical protein